MKRILYLTIFLLFLTNCSSAQNTDRQANINSIFSKMELQGVDIKKPLLYGYFFYDKEKSKLENLKDDLVKANYKLVRLETADKDKYILHVERVEVHSRKSLFERENELDKLSKKYAVSTYDGWDVGNADPAKPLVSSDSYKKLLETNSSAELYRLASGLYDSETYDKAIIAYQKCIEQNYKKDTCYYKQGVSYTSLGQIKIGIKKLEEALKINPKYFKACFNIGAACYDNQEYEKSIEHYQKAAKLEPKDSRVFYGIAASQFVLGQFKSAEINCQTALKFNPNNDNAKTLLIKIQKKSS